MTEEVEAVYEHGVLRPLGPLSFIERQKVRLTISDTQSAVAALTREIEKVQAEASSTPLSSEAIISSVGRILPVVAHAVAVFGDEQKASHWLETPLPLLGDRSPSQLLESAEGVELVEQVLTRIEHNIPS
jgi:putative toxin-antitoxin system antitoxin component (TIGR02293 family)